ncbi:hypothetical protein ACQP2U_41325 [Nocardia sp. CA-084685]|uniref:hypothetical protein n=1 Tax=Nocardia sp. CA-084685 TaxID=3239970 RepID=UPI003D99F23B
MNELIDEVLTAHGGLARWRAATALTAHGRFGGLLPSRFPGNRMANVTVRMQLAQQHAVFHDFPQQDQQAVFDRGDVRIETRDGEPISARRNARAAFAGLSGLRRNLRDLPGDLDTQPRPDTAKPGRRVLRPGLPRMRRVTTQRL